MRGVLFRLIRSQLLIAIAVFQATQFPAFAQGDYTVVNVSNGGTISGNVKWPGRVPHDVEFPVTKDIEICDPRLRKTTGLDRLVVGPDGGVANTVVYLVDISRGKAIDLPEQRRHLDQRTCHYVPHILLVPTGADLTMLSSDATLHTVHMDGAATFNLSFPFPNRPNTRTMKQPGIIHVRCNGGHEWMNAEIMVVKHPYFAVTEEDGSFQLTNVPPGTYRIAAWHEGWRVQSKPALDFSTQSQVARPVFSEPKIIEKTVSVMPNQNTVVDFSLSAN